MAILDVFKVSFRTFLAPTRWMGLKQIKANTRYLISVIRGLFRIERAERIETFEESLERQGLTEEEVIKTGEIYLKYAILFVILSAVCFAASLLFLIMKHSFFGWLFGTLSMLLFLSQAFRYHFWHFQIKHRKLGCTFKEWWQGKLNPSEDAKP